MSYDKWLIVGANRGIGFGLVKAIIALNENTQVFATTRNPSSSNELIEFAKQHQDRVIVIKADFNDDSNSTAIVEQIKKHTSTLEHVIVNSGIGEARQPLVTVNASDLRKHFDVNVVAAFNATKALYPLLQESKASKRDLSFMSTAVSSIGNTTKISGMLSSLFGVDFNPVGVFAISKAALNMLGRMWATVLEPEGIAVALLDPGTVKTDAMDIPNAISVKESSEGLINVIKNLGLKMTDAGIMSYNGTVIPW